MNSRRLPVTLLSFSLLAAGAPAFAQDDKEKVPPEKVEKVVEARAEKERKKRENQPEGADPGESSYNVSDCGGGWKGEKSASNDSSSDDSSGSDSSAVDDCENIKQ